MSITFKRTGKSIKEDCMDALKAHGISCQLDNCLRVVAKMPDGLWHLCECWRRSSECWDEFCIDIDQDKRFSIRL